MESNDKWFETLLLNFRKPTKKSFENQRLIRILETIVDFDSIDKHLFAVVGRFGKFRRTSQLGSANFLILKKLIAKPS